MKGHLALFVGSRADGLNLVALQQGCLEQQRIVSGQR
jgi:hypothetical protein